VDDEVDAGVAEVADAVEQHDGMRSSGRRHRRSGRRGKGTAAVGTGCSRPNPPPRWGVDAPAFAAASRDFATPSLGSAARPLRPISPAGDRFCDALRPLIRAIVRPPFAVLALAVLLTALALAAAVRLDIDTDLANLLPEDYPSV